MGQRHICHPPSVSTATRGPSGKAEGGKSGDKPLFATRTQKTGGKTTGQRHICHPSRAVIARFCLVGADCGGKFGITALFATRKWNLGGKLGVRS